jgi:excinuclease UvrABC nuclease subunit
VAPEDLTATIGRLKADMNDAAEALEFERAAEIRDRVKELEQRALAELEEGEVAVNVPAAKRSGAMGGKSKGRKRR